MALFRRPSWRTVVGLGASLAAAAVISTPISIALAIGSVNFTDQLGTIPVQVSLARNGTSSLDTGVLGTIHTDHTGPLGFGATARVTGPPEAGGTLASYVDPEFLRAYVTLIDDPGRIAAAYGARFVDELRDTTLLNVALGTLGGGVLLFYLVPRTRLRNLPRGQVIAVTSVLVVLATGVSAGAGWVVVDRWDGSRSIGPTYAMSSVSGLSFSSPQTREVAEQIEPFVTKNLTRMRAEAAAYESAARESFTAALAPRVAGLSPREGERIVIAEADTQGSFVGARVRSQMYDALSSALGSEAFAARTISGDITSNGAVAESTYLADEGAVSGPIPTLAAAGDHDSETTWSQLADADIIGLDRETTEVGGVQFAGIHDREHKALFGGLVTNPEGISETELGHLLRAEVADRTVNALVHQPVAAAAYLGVDSIMSITDLEANLTTPYDDGLADVPPGSLSYGHWHQADGPWVVWNTDSDQVTWTLVDQLGTAGGVENAPTISRFSTPISAPLKPVMVRLHYVNTASGLTTGFATISCDLTGDCTVSDRTDVGLPGGMPGAMSGAMSGGMPVSP